jgi:hypothetical protein
MAVVCGIAVKANAGIDRCQAVEISWDADDDYADVLTARLVKDCHRPTAFVWLGSGDCVLVTEPSFNGKGGDL